MIAIVHPLLNLRGGAERKLLLICKALLDKGFCVTLFVKIYEKEKTFSELIDPRLCIRQISSQNSIFWVIKTYWALRKQHWDLLISSNFPAHLALLPIQGKKAWICNEVAALKRKVPLYIRPLLYWERFSAKAFDCVIANSKATAEEIADYYGVCAKVIYSGIILEEFNPKEAIRKEISQLKSYILVLSRIEMHKNLKFLESICSRFPNRQIVVAGTGEDSSFIENLAKKHPHLLYLGGVSPNEKNFLYQSCALFAFLPKNEPLGVTVMEALAANRPVVAFASGGPLETLLDGQNGFLCHTEQAFLQAMDSLCEKNWVLPKAMGIHYIAARFSCKAMQENFLNLFQHLISSVEPIGRH